MSSYFANVREDVLRLLPIEPVQRVLEIGGGDFPTLLEIGRRTGAELWGTDIRPTAAPNIRFVEGSFDDSNLRAQLPDHGFDLIVANDVIEHLLDSEGFFQTVARKLKPGGHLAISVPNIRQVRSLYHIFLRGRFPRDDAGLFDRTHVRWFCKKDVLELAARADIEFVSHQVVGRLVPGLIKTFSVAEFLGLQNIFLFRSKQ